MQRDPKVLVFIKYARVAIASHFLGGRVEEQVTAQVRDTDIKGSLIRVARFATLFNQAVFSVSELLHCPSATEATARLPISQQIRHGFAILICEQMLHGHSR